MKKIIFVVLTAVLLVSCTGKEPTPQPEDKNFIYMDKSSLYLNYDSTQHENPGDIYTTRQLQYRISAYNITSIPLGAKNVKFNIEYDGKTSGQAEIQQIDESYITYGFMDIFYLTTVQDPFNKLSFSGNYTIDYNQNPNVYCINIGVLHIEHWKTHPFDYDKLKIKITWE